VKMRSWHIKGLTKRWVFNVLSVILLVIFLVETVAVILLNNYTTASVNDYMNSTLYSIVQLFDEDTIRSTSSFEVAAKEYTESSYNNEKIEIQFFSPKGELIISTSGFGDNTDVNTSDFDELLENNISQKVYNTKLQGGEKVVCSVATVPSSANENYVVGGIRIISSLESVYRHMYLQMAIIIAIGALLFFLVMISGTYFVRSIIVPLRNISDTARQIALGDFEARIESESREDEVGMLCDTINYMAGELGSTEKMKNEFISSVSHELRTPLTAIKGWGETVLSSLDDPEITKKGIDVMIGEAERLSVIVEDLLDFSRLQSGHFSYNMELCDVVAELSEAVLTLTDTAKRSNIKIDFSEPNNIPPVLGDPIRLQQVFVNIIDNAIKYTPENGSIVIDASVNGGHIEIMISDNGKGIPAEDLDHVKQKFFKAKNSTRGSGIGLAVANEIIENHGELLDIASTEHVGTTVSINLPVHKPEI